MKGTVCCMLLLTVVMSSVLANPNWMTSAGSYAYKGAKFASDATGKALEGAAGLTNGVPVLGSALGRSNSFYQNLTSFRSSLGLFVRSFLVAFRVFGFENVVVFIKVFREMVLSAIESAKTILKNRLSSIPIVGSSFKNADDILDSMMKYGKAAGLPAEPILATYTSFLLLVNGLMSAIN